MQMSIQGWTCEWNESELCRVKQGRTSRFFPLYKGLKSVVRSSREAGTNRRPLPKDISRKGRCLLGEDSIRFCRTLPSFQDGNAFEMGGVGHHVEPSEPHDMVASTGELGKVPREGFGVAADVDQT